MQAKPFKFRHINQIVGAFLFVIVAILLVVGILAGRSQEWFAEVTEYRVEMPGGLPGEEAGGTLGIKAGSDVRVIGNQVGYVKRVELCKGDELEPLSSMEEVPLNEIRIAAVLSVKGDFARFIGSDSEAVLKFDLGGLGSAYFDISRGSVPFPDEGLVDADRILRFDQEEDAKEEVFQIAQRIEDEIIPAIRSYRETAETSTAFIQKLSDENEVLYRSLVSLEEGIADLNAVMAQAKSGDGALGDMISSNSQMRKEFNEFAVTLNAGTQNLNAAIGNLNDGIDSLRENGIRSINEGAEGFPAIIQKTDVTVGEVNEASAQLQEVLRETELLVEGLQKHWLVKAYVKDPIEDGAEETKPSKTGIFGRRDKPKTGAENKGTGMRLFNRQAE